MRALALVLVLGSLGAVPASAQNTYGNYRVRTQVVYGNDPCPKSNNPDEVIVCARQPEENRYRIPKIVRDDEKAAIARRDNVGDRRAALASGALSATGIGSGSAVGPGGAFGAHATTDVRTVVKNLKDGVENTGDPSNPQ